jgi:Rne/Rng family ribonuclease
MSKELVISANRHETRVALIEDDQLCEVYFQRANEYSLAGSIHKGRVTRVLPGMQSAFVDLGLERDTFLYVSDFLEEQDDIDRVTGDEAPAPRERDRDRDRDRDRGREHRPQPPRVEAAPAPVDAPAAEAHASMSPPAETAAPSGDRPPRLDDRPRSDDRPRPDDRGGDDRRGRRSRRRRNRGRGIPDSKYATDFGPRPAPVESKPQAIEETEETAVGEEPPIILPGESLAKYRGGSQTAETPAVNGAPEVPVASGVEDVVENEYDEIIHYPPENALPDAPVHAAASEPAAAQVAPTAIEEAPASVAVEMEVDEVEEEQQAEAEGAAELGPIVAPLLDEEEDRDIQEMILKHAGLEEGIEESVEESLEVVEAGEEDGEAQTAEGESEAQPAGEPDSGTAAVRERGGRYPHRVSRRTRRRRGGPSQGPGPFGPGQGESPRGEQRGEARFEQRGGPREERAVARPAPGSGMPSISDLLKEGQEIIVQIAKEPLGQKGARITSHVALPGRYVVYMPTLEHMGVSRKIASDEERLRLKRILQGRRPGPTGGFITRTAAEGRTEEEIAGDMAFLYNLWQDIRAKAERRPAPMLLHHDLDIVQRILRDQLADSFKAIWIDSEETYESVLRFVERFQPALVGKVKLYTREAPIFDAFSVTAELEKALRPKVWLKSGGFIVINQTEALVAIDVNTGKYVGKTNRLEDTIVKTNTEAIKEIVRQVRLRDLGGIIVIDFIDMDERKNRQKVMQTLEEAMRADRAPYKILQFNDFGLVAITRKRVKQSLERTLCSPCPHCEGAGYIKSAQTVVGEILTEARKMAASVEGKDVMLRVHPDVAKLLKSHQNKYLEELEEVLRRPVLVKSDPLLHHEKFDLA